MKLKKSPVKNTGPGKRKALDVNSSTVNDAIFHQTGPRLLAYLVGLYSLFCLFIIYEGVVWIVSPLREGIAFGVMIITVGIIYGVGIFYWAYKIYQACEARSRLRIRYYSVITLIVSTITMAYLMYGNSDADSSMKAIRVGLTLLLALLSLWSYATNRTEEDDYWNKRKKRI